MCCPCSQVSTVRRDPWGVALDLNCVSEQPVEGKRVGKVNLLEKGPNTMIAVGTSANDFEAHVNLGVGQEGYGVHTAKVADSSTG
jgi:hypothetical protein